MWKPRTKDADLFHSSSWAKDEVEFTTLSGYPAKTLSETLKQTSAKHIQVS